MGMPTASFEASQNRSPMSRELRPWSGGQPALHMPVNVRLVFCQSP